MLFYFLSCLLNIFLSLQYLIYNDIILVHIPNHLTGHCSLLTQIKVHSPLFCIELPKIKSDYSLPSLKTSAVSLWTTGHSKTWAPTIPPTGNYLIRWLALCTYSLPNCLIQLTPIHSTTFSISYEPSNVKGLENTWWVKRQKSCLPRPWIFSLLKCDLEQDAFLNVSKNYENVFLTLYHNMLWLLMYLRQRQM